MRLDEGPRAPRPGFWVTIFHFTQLIITNAILPISHRANLLGLILDGHFTFQKARNSINSELKLRYACAV